MAGPTSSAADPVVSPAGHPARIEPHTGVAVARHHLDRRPLGRGCFRSRWRDGSGRRWRRTLLRGRVRRMAPGQRAQAEKTQEVTQIEPLEHAHLPLAKPAHPRKFTSAVTGIARWVLPSVIDTMASRGAAEALIAGLHTTETVQVC